MVNHVPSNVFALWKHASGSTSAQPAVPEPSFAERARSLIYSGSIGTLSLYPANRRFPFGSLMPYGLDADGRPIFLISTMAMQTQNLQGDLRAGLFVTESDIGDQPLGASRVTLIGNVTTTRVGCGGSSFSLSGGLSGQQVLGRF